MDRHVWQYNGVAPCYVIVDWCNNNLTDGKWGYNGWEMFDFLDSGEYSLFLLRWAQ